MEYELAELLPIVESLSRKYTRNESTSISYETAQKLMEAVLYCIQEMEYASADLPAAVLSAADAYTLGYAAVLRKTKQTAERYNTLMDRFSSYGNRAYEETIAQGFPAFFRWYDPLFAPQEHILTLDYPLLRPLEALCGIDRIAAYLECIEIEQRFLRCFSEEFICSALSKHHPQWEGLFLNLPYHVLKKLLCLLMLDIHQEKERFSDIDYINLRTKLNGLSKEALKEKLTTLFQQFCAQYFPQDTAMEAYLEYAVGDIAAELWLGLEKDCLSHIV